MCSALAYCPFFMVFWSLLLQGIVLIALYHNFQLLNGSRGSNWKKLWPLKTREFCQYMICCSVHLVYDLGFLIYACLSTHFLGLATTYMWFACLFLCLKCFVFWIANIWCCCRPYRKGTFVVHINCNLICRYTPCNIVFNYINMVNSS